jgi:hypothetical protein
MREISILGKRIHLRLLRTHYKISQSLHGYRTVMHCWHTLDGGMTGHNCDGKEEPKVHHVVRW